ncbi:MAG: hypothetical protein NT027_11885 [Proteobacteria bacterium]|nr:hypothetical protein [Pseudomonadota bacterium]
MHFNYRIISISSHHVQDNWLRYTMSFLFGAVSVAALAEDDQRLYRSAHYLGRGDTGIAVADDHEAIMYNPAGIAQGKGIYKRTILASPMIEFSDDARSLVNELNDKSADTTAILRKRIGKNQHLGLYNLSAIVLRRVAIGVLASGTTDILVYKSPDAGGLEGVDAKIRQTTGVTFSVAESFWNEKLLIGTTLKYLQRGQAQLVANVTDAESLKSQRLKPSFGLTVRNVGTTKFTASTSTAPKPDSLKQVVDVGVAIQPGTKVSSFKILADYWDLTSAIYDSPYKKLHLGGELSIKDMLGFTAGISQGWSSAGIYADLYIMRIDGGIYIQEVSDRAGVRPDKRLFLRVSAGF